MDAQVAGPLGQRNHSTSHSAGLGTVPGEHLRCRNQAAAEGIGRLAAEDHDELSSNRYGHFQSLVEGIRRKDRGRRQ